MRKLIWLTLVIATLVTSLFLVANVNASTSVSGTITADTTWTRAGSPYVLSGPVNVNSGATLTIEPGVTVDLYSYSLQVYGTLVAAGTSDNKIVFTTGSANNIRIMFNPSSTVWNESTGSGCIVENAVFNAATISVSNCSPKISNNYFTNSLFVAVSGSSGSPLIINNVFNCRNTAISLTSGSPTITSNYVKGGSLSTYGIYVGNSSCVSNNNVTGSYMGIYVTGNSTIYKNLVTSNTFGIYASGSLATIENNVIANNSIGILGGGFIRNNTIGNNTIGIGVSSASCVINQNNFFNNTQYTVGLSSVSGVDATSNWWGTTDTSTINQTIYDSKNSTSTTPLGTVTFTPFLNEPNPNAPALESVNYIPNPTPTPIPSPIPIPTVTPYPVPTHTPIPLPPPNITISPIVTPTPLPTATPTPTPSPIPTPIPTPKIMPGSPLSLGGATFAETISQFDITNLAKLVLVALGVIWVIVILFYVDREFTHKGNKKKLK
jgi:hypothetical protein